MTLPGPIKTDKRLQKALQYVSDYWLPVNAQVAEKIREGLEGGVYDTNRALLTKDLSSDLSLFFGCLRELREILLERGSKYAPQTDLTLIIEDVDLDVLKLALKSMMEGPSIHLLSEGDEAQVVRLFEAVLSATSAQTLAPGYGAAPGAALSLAALRQLGYALVAWNYPTVYQEALNEVQADSPHSLDELIAKQLGFTPLLLASRLATSWGLPAELSEAALVPSIPMYEDAMIISATTETLSQICRVSEALARAQFDTVYPEARGEWEAAKSEVERRLGPQGIEKIRERCAAVSQIFLSTSPDVFRPGLLLDEQHFRGSSPTVRNPYAELCNPALQLKLEQLYEMIPNSKPSAKALKFLIREVIPHAHFSGGCVFTVDPTMCALVPQLEIGTTELRSNQPVPYLVEDHGDDPVPLAFLTTEGCKPVISENNREGFCSLTSAFGRSQRIGVLYLEISSKEMKALDKRALLHFQAINHALVDCLGL